MKFYSIPIFLFLFLSLLSISTSSADISNQNGLDLYKSPSGRSLLGHNEIDELFVDDRILIDHLDGRVYLQERDSGKTVWRSDLATIAVLVGVTDGDVIDDNPIFLPGKGKFGTDIYSEGILNKIVEDYIKHKPYISNNTLSLGECKITMLSVDIKSGKLINVYSSAEGENALSERHANAVVAANILYIQRTDCSLLSFSMDPKKILWRANISYIQDCYILDQERKRHVPFAHVRDISFVHFLLGISNLNSSDIMPYLAPTRNGSSKSFVVANTTGQDSLPCLPLKRNGSAASFVNAGITSQNSTPSLVPEETEKNSTYAAIQDYSSEQKSSGSDKSHFRKLQYITLFCFLLVFISWYTGIITISRQKSTKELKSATGKHTSGSKKKKARKSANDNNGAHTKAIAKNITDNDANKFASLSSDTRNGKDSWANGRIPFDTDENGRRIGKLFISNKEIAKGSNGTIVMEGIYDGRPVAVKRLVQAHHDVASKEIQNLIASDRHPNIVRWYGVEYDSDFVYLSLERCTCSLGDLIKMCSYNSCHSVSTQGKNLNSAAEYNIQLDTAKGINKHVELWKANGYPSMQLLKLMRDIVSGLVHLHELGIVHRDLKPQNILIIDEKYLCAKLSDMGISKRLPEDKSSLGCHPTGYGSSGWQAPEQLLNGRQTRAVDLFGLGCVLFFCMTGGKHPYGEHLERDINIVKNQIDLFMVEHIPEAVDLFSRLLDPDPELRPTAVYVLHHPLFWSSEIRLSFLRDASDRVELEDRENESDLLKALENVGPVALGGKWDEKMETVFMNNIGRYRRYKFESTRDLLRVMRNKLNHYRELPKEIQELLGSVPDGFDAYFSSRFPKFLIEVYKVMYRYCKEEECFWKYFKTV